ncbi:Lacal_2735 family protein [Winogradskyella litorisediminis]|uniref:Lacal_2735 family protein n=1 Tax=Winogradskyella litorisediminis TaxID=1156618 RepID=A0ABW3NCJ7_9FLAO
MTNPSKLIKKKQKLKKRYLRLVEEAYNFKQTNHELSDIAEFKALQVLHRLNQLKFLERDFFVHST